MLPLRARVDLGAMAIKGYSAFPKAPALLEPHHQIFSVIIRTLMGGDLTPLQRSSRCILQPQPTGQLMTRYSLLMSTYAILKTGYSFLFSFLNFWDKPWRFLSLRVFGLLSSSLLLFQLRFRFLSNPGTKSFFESSGVACSDSWNELGFLLLSLVELALDLGIYLGI